MQVWGSTLYAFKTHLKVQEPIHHTDARMHISSGLKCRSVLRYFVASVEYYDALPSQSGAHICEIDIHFACGQAELKSLVQTTQGQQPLDCLES